MIADAPFGPSSVAIPSAFPRGGLEALAEKRRLYMSTVFSEPIPMIGSPMLEWALRYVRRGWRVFPLEVRSKMPMLSKEQGGRGCLDATLDEAQVRERWTKWPDANIGLATGHGWFALDVDIKRGGDETWDMLCAQHGATTETIEQITGTGGLHILYQEPAGFKIKNSDGKIAPGLNVRGEGGYIVACPSVHPDTQRAFEWQSPHIDERKIGSAPAWLLQLIRASGQRRLAPSEVTPLAIFETSRSSALFKAGVRLRGLGFSESEVSASLGVINRGRCHPALGAEEVETIAATAARRPLDARGNLLRNESITPDGALTAEAEVENTQAEIETAADVAMWANDIGGAFDLAPRVARLSPSGRALIMGKFSAHFKEHFQRHLFEQAMGFTPTETPRSLSAGAPQSDVTWPDLMKQPLTDSGNGERILAMYGDQIRFCIEMERWLVWDGRRWAVDDRGRPSQLMKQMARKLYAQASLVQQTPEGQAALKWARISESNERISAGLKRASTEASILISLKELDQQSFLLNCLNGVVDLRTGALLAHDRDLFITKLCRVKYDPHAQCLRFLKFLHWAMGQNPEADLSTHTVRMVGFLQRAFGYTLTADVSEKAAFIFYGPKGNNGKTTLLNLFRKILGEYSAQISIDTLMAQRGFQDAGVRADMSDVSGARFVVTSEVEEGNKLGEGKLKYITAGQGEIKGCRKYENPIEFTATHKLFMDCNDLPQVRGTDEAIWNRLKCIPFDVRIEDTDPEYNPNLIDKLVTEAPGILAWAVRGCIAWQTEGLGVPPEIRQAVLDWREHDDPLKEFLEDCCDVLTAEERAEGKEMWVRRADLTQAYGWWCKKNREEFPLARSVFLDRIKAKGFATKRRRDDAGTQIRTTEGLKLCDDVAK